jgi:hypothetical protein
MWGLGSLNDRAVVAVKEAARESFQKSFQDSMIVMLSSWFLSLPFPLFLFASKKKRNSLPILRELTALFF